MEQQPSPWGSVSPVGGNQSSGMRQEEGNG